jgi:hypothetical protein
MKKLLVILCLLLGFIISSGCDKNQTSSDNTAVKPVLSPEEWLKQKRGEHKISDAEIKELKNKLVWADEQVVWENLRKLNTKDFWTFWDNLTDDQQEYVILLYKTLRKDEHPTLSVTLVDIENEYNYRKYLKKKLNILSSVDKTQLPFTAENGSYYGELNENGVPKTVFVRGYYRKNGTYVGSYYRTPPISNYNSTNNSENESYYGEISESTGRPKTVHVNGYYRKDGTYVKGYYRSAPRRKK